MLKKKPDKSARLFRGRDILCSAVEDSCVARPSASETPGNIWPVNSSISSPSLNILYRKMSPYLAVREQGNEQERGVWHEFNLDQVDQVAAHWT